MDILEKFLMNARALKESFGFIYKEKGEMGFSVLQKTLEEADVLFQKYETPLPIIQHSVMVANLSLYFVLSQKPDCQDHWVHILQNFPQDEKNKERFQRLLGKLARGAIFHDIGKWQSIQSMRQTQTLNHAQIGENILRREGLGFEAKVCSWHLLVPFVEGARMSAPAKIVNLSDKMVEESLIVSLEHRFSALKIRYGNKDPYLNEHALKVYKEYLLHFDLSLFPEHQKILNETTFTHRMSYK